MKKKADGTAGRNGNGSEASGGKNGFGGREASARRADAAGIAAVKFLPNRVWRVYAGGSGIDRLRGVSPAVDGHFPEDWIASTSEANNPQYPKADQGLSFVELPDGPMRFTDYLARDPEKTLGRRHHARFGANAGLLMKILDAAEQLPIQCHPSVADARRYYHSDFGKTEAWYVIAVREVNGEKPFLLVGFNERLDEKVFREEALSGTFSSGGKMLHKLEVKPGDCLLIRGGLPHAIGCGVTLIEVMEPSDLVIQPELFCGSQPLSESERWSGAAPEDALKCFDYTPLSESEVRRRNILTPEQADESLQILIPRTLAKYFEVQKMVCRGRYTLRNREQCHRAGVVVRGEVSLDDGVRELTLKTGDAFFLPCALEQAEFRGTGEVIFALPPDPLP